jgi:hypothetical protein
MSTKTAMKRLVALSPISDRSIRSTVGPAFGWAESNRTEQTGVGFAAATEMGAFGGTASLTSREDTIQTPTYQPAASALQDSQCGVAARRAAGGPRGVFTTGGTQLSSVVRSHSAHSGSSAQGGTHPMKNSLGEKEASARVGEMFVSPGGQPDSLWRSAVLY